MILISRALDGAPTNETQQSTDCMLFEASREDKFHSSETIDPEDAAVIDSTPQEQSSEGAGPSAAQTRRLRKPLSYYLEAYAFLGLLVLAALFFSTWSETSQNFTSAANIRTLIASNAVLAIVAIGALVPLVCYEFDLSLGAIAGLSSIFVASVLANGTSIPIAVALGLAIGVVVGLANALLITRIGVNAVITTLGTSIIIDGIMNEKSGGLAITGNIPLGFSQFGSSNFVGVPKIAFVLAAIAIGVYYLLEHMPFSRYLYAFGTKRNAARLVGIRKRLTLGLTFVISGAPCGAAGILQVARGGGADPRVGDGFTLPALAAAFLSAAALKPGRYNIAGTLVAIVFLGVLNNGLNLTGAPSTSTAMSTARS